MRIIIFSLFKASCKGHRKALGEEWSHMLHLFKTAKTISGSRGKGSYNKDNGGKDKVGSERRSSRH